MRTPRVPDAVTPDGPPPPPPAPDAPAPEPPADFWARLRGLLEGSATRYARIPADR